MGKPVAEKALPIFVSHPLHWVWLYKFGHVDFVLGKSISPCQFIKHYSRPLLSMGGSVPGIPVDIEICKHSNPVLWLGPEGFLRLTETMCNPRWCLLASECLYWMKNVTTGSDFLCFKSLIRPRETLCESPFSRYCGPTNITNILPNKTSFLQEWR